MTSKVYQEISSLLLARQNCAKKACLTALMNHTERLEQIIKNCLPSGSGIDCGTKLEPESTPEKLVFLCEYHHMNSNGYYNGWTTYKIIVKASLFSELDIKITGRDRNEIKDYLHGAYYSALTADCLE